MFYKKLIFMGLAIAGILSGSMGAIQANAHPPIERQQVINSTPTVRDLVPFTKSQLNAYQKDQQELLAQKAELLQSQFENNKPVEDVIKTWNQIASSTQVYGSTLWVMQAEALKDDDEIKHENISNAQAAVADDYNKLLQHESMKTAFETYADRKLHQPEGLTPFQWHYLYSIAQGYGLNELAKELQAKDRQDFESFESNAPIKTLPKDGSFSILSGNSIFMPDNYTYYFGGIKPWRQRIDPLSEKILEQNKDVVVLQEVFDEEGAKSLKDKLQHKYRYFYYNMGTNYFGLNAPENQGIQAENLGINSGLFVASKYPIEQNFRPFEIEDMQWQVKKGMSISNVKSEGKTVVRVITTHLQPFNKDKDRLIRQKEMQAIIDYIKQNPIEGPTFVAGDLNIVFGERTFDGKTVNEYANSAIEENFVDLYNETAVTPDNYTCSDAFEDQFYGRSLSEPYIYDYVLVKREDASKITNMKIRRVEMHHLDHPTEMPLSDHHWLATDTYLTSAENPGHS